MPDRRPVQIDYQGQTMHGEWWVEDGQVHVVSPCGRRSEPLRPSLRNSLPSEQAARMLWTLTDDAGPNRPING